jgi:hypothetical protein
MTYKKELIEAGARALLDGRELQHDVRSNVTAILDAMLAYRSTVECPTCGGTGVVDEADSAGFDPDAGYEDWSRAGFGRCPAGCIDGRVPRPERLAVVEPAGHLPDHLHLRSCDWCSASIHQTAKRVFILAPDLPEGTP